MSPVITANVQDKMTFKFSKTAMEITHPSGVKTTSSKADVQKWLDGIDAEITRLAAQKARIQKDYLDKINAVAAIGP